MKYLVGILIIACLAMDIHAQTYNQSIEDPVTGEEVLYGKVIWEGLKEPPFAGWFEESYNNYKPESDILEVLDRDVLNTWFVTIVMGTWCSDIYFLPVQYGAGARGGKPGRVPGEGTFQGVV